MRAAGVTGLSRYLSWQDRDSLGKVIGRAEFDALIAAGFALVLNWEYSATDWTGGSSAGTTHATEAVRQARALGYPPGHGLIGSADFDMTSAQWFAACQGYAGAFAKVVRGAGYRPGVYGPWDVLTWCRDAGFMEVFWQAGMSTAWSSRRNASVWPGAHLRQRRQVFIGGVDCDSNDILRFDYGQYGGPMTTLDDKFTSAIDQQSRTYAQMIADVHEDLIVGGFGPPWRRQDGLADSVRQILTKVDEPTQVTLTLSDADRDAIAQKVSELVVPALMAASSTAVADELARRLGNG